MKPWVDIIRENAIFLGGHKDHVSACLFRMLYCIESSTAYNLAFFFLKRMEKTRNKPKELLPYGMLLTRLFNHVVSVSPKLAFDHYLSHDRAMHPLAPHYKRKTRSDHGKKRPRESNTSSSSSSTTQNHPSLSLPLDATGDENDDESFHSHSYSPSQNIFSSSNVVPRVRQNLPHENHILNTYLSETINIQTKQRDDHQDGLRREHGFKIVVKFVVTKDIDHLRQFLIWGKWAAEIRDPNKGNARNQVRMQTLDEQLRSINVPLKPLRLSVLIQNIQKMLSGDTIVVAETDVGGLLMLHLGYAQATTDERMMSSIGDGNCSRCVDKAVTRA
uniref:Pyruvate decarboxylase 1 n=1 Tax=Tanacetum cinerariifolium TaxID=118510 RepID=A0A6L2NMV3_TANCI|nr:pyruvate decarboxylase 1 [Tanacetum cinerariifolium]